MDWVRIRVHGTWYRALHAEHFDEPGKGAFLILGAAPFIRGNRCSILKQSELRTPTFEKMVSDFKVDWIDSTSLVGASEVAIGAVVGETLICTNLGSLKPELSSLVVGQSYTVAKVIDRRINLRELPNNWYSPTHFKRELNTKPMDADNNNGHDGCEPMINQLVDFGTALQALKKGSRITREGWNGKGMHVYMEEHFKFVAGNHQREYPPVLVLLTSDNKHQAGWNASTPDVLAEDWIVLDSL